MKKAILFIIAIFCSITVTISAKNQCLLIGIGHYPKHSGWNNISSVNDVNLLKNILEPTFSTFTLTDNEATHEAIINVIKAVTDDVQLGDTVLIHFSCHGQQVLTIDNNEPDYLDEALVPFDASSIKSKDYSGEKHLLDNELENLIIPLRKKAGLHGLIIVTLDACFSDSMNKGDKVIEETGVFRGGADIFGSNMISPDSLIEIEKRRKKRDELRVEKIEGAADIVILSACQSYQKNMEIVSEGIGYGSLSYAMFLSFRDKGFRNVKDWLNGVLEQMSEIAYMQTPQLRTTLNISDAVKSIRQPEHGQVEDNDFQLFQIKNIVVVLLSIVFLIGAIIWKKRKH